MTDYTPVDCAVHSEYELAITHARRLRVSWCTPDDDQRHIETLKPLDLQTCNHEEYLLAERRDGLQMKLRLDYIRKIETI